MKQFINGSDGDYTVLEERAVGRCIRYKDQELPPTCSPSHAHVGFEVNVETGKVTLLVSNNVSYSGTNRSIQEWLECGEIQFDSFERLKNWIRADIRMEFDAVVLPSPYAGGIDCPLTNMEEILKNLPGRNAQCFFDEGKLLADLKKKVVGQDSALEKIVRATVRHCARPHPSRPAVVFSVGPSGVGKTLTAEFLKEAMANQDGGGDFQYLRLDMTEYQESHRVSQLLGSPQGYLGHGEGSQFIDALRSNPRTILLLDEIEKAHPSIMRVFMNAMDAGRISASSSDGGGYEVDCRKAIFIFTSNLDASGILAELNPASDPVVVDTVCRRRLKASGIAPEIIGRIGSFLVYFPLGQGERARIIAMSIAEIVGEYGLALDYVAPETVVSFMKNPSDDDFGARPSKYFIDDQIGGLCIAAAKQGLNTISLFGPPYRIEAAG
ncbi:AAA family ATPase [Pontiellaceae bacterium B12227]|nr:AAA family ATPase [Pontiellaceae bacterium B12227]